MRIIAFLLALQFALLRLRQPRHQSLNSFRGKQMLKKETPRSAPPSEQSIHGMNDKDADLEKNQYNNKILNFDVIKFQTG